jgi:predicted ATPase
MATLTIKNIGPIKSVENLELNKVNLFMGLQSSGKSTIAKIISFCTWMEKRAARADILELLEEGGKWIDRLKIFHRLSNGYFSTESAIYYNGEYVNYLFN